jgi:hypothetical protein
VRGWLVDFKFLVSEDINASDVSLGVSVLTSLRGSDFNDFAWEFVLGKNVVTLSELTSFDWIGKGSSLLFLEIFFRAIFLRL